MSEQPQDRPESTDSTESSARPEPAEPTPPQDAPAAGGADDGGPPAQGEGEPDSY